MATTTSAAMAMAASKPRSSEGCWTCRLRRKKCDEARPECQACVALEIECLYSDAKPDWMDGGELQRVRAEQVKAEVKRKAGWRRERRYMMNLEGSLQDLEMTDGPDGTHLLAGNSGAGRPAPAAATRRQNQPAQPQQPRPAEPMQLSTSNPVPSSSSPLGPSPESSSNGYSTTNGFTPPSFSQSATGTQGTSPDSTTDMPAPPALTQLPPIPAPIGPGKDGAQVVYQLSTERELHLAMVYLDYVFPFLFPFYRPPLATGGRSWLLILLLNNKALFHAALSLASYFFNCWLHAVDAGATASCIEHSLEELTKQQELSVRELMTDIADINAKGIKGRLRESTRVLASIMQILCFEAAIGNTASSWTLHLDGAVVLLDQIMSLNAQTAHPGNVTCWGSIILQLDNPPHDPPRISPHYRPLNAHQAALTFFIAVLLHFDIVSSTALETAPRLTRYHLGLLRTPSEIMAATHDMHAHPPDVSCMDCPDSLCSKLMEFVSSQEYPICDEPAIDLVSVSGAANWALLAVAQVAALAAWKKEQQRVMVGGFLALDANATLELATRSAVIESWVRARLTELDSGAAAARKPPARPRPEMRLSAAVYVPAASWGVGTDSAPPVPLPTAGFPDHDLLALNSDWVTRTWAQAALTYLIVVAEGWHQQPSREPSPCLRASVCALLELLLKRPTPACLRTVGWPFAVGGCLADQDQEEHFREMVRSIGGGLEVFGTIKEAFRIMEEVWARRAEIRSGETGEWDLARCFALGDRRVLLV